MPNDEIVEAGKLGHDIGFASAREYYAPICETLRQENADLRQALVEFGVADMAINTALQDIQRRRNES